MQPINRLHGVKTFALCSLHPGSNLLDDVEAVVFAQDSAEALRLAHRYFPDTRRKRLFITDVYDPRVLTLLERDLTGPNAHPLNPRNISELVGLYARLITDRETAKVKARRRKRTPRERVVVGGAGAVAPKASAPAVNPADTPVAADAVAEPFKRKARERVAVAGPAVASAEAIAEAAAKGPRIKAAKQTGPSQKAVDYAVRILERERLKGATIPPLGNGPSLSDVAPAPAAPAPVQGTLGLDETPTIAEPTQRLGRKPKKQASPVAAARIKTGGKRKTTPKKVKAKKRAG